MRYAITDRVLQLALAMQGSRIGLSLDDIERDFRVGRRTAQRMRDAVLRSYPQAERLVDEERRPRWRIPATGTVTPGAVTAEELADLEAMARLARRENQRRRAQSLEDLVRKLRAALKPDVVRRIEPDLEALLEAEGLAMRPGPRPVIDPGVVDVIRLAIKQGRELYVAYRSRHTRKSSGRRIHPYGFLFGSRHYLVGVSPDRHPGAPRLFALSGIRQAQVTERAFHRDPAFSLQRFAEQSFGVFQEPPHDVAWRFAPELADAAEEFVFHPMQTLERQADGSLVVRFRAGGLLEMCWHLFSWGAGVEVLQPPELKDLMSKAHRHRNFVTEA